MQIINNDKLSQATVNKEFFPFLHVENIFSDEGDRALIIKDFPKITAGGSCPADSIPSGESINKLICELESNEVKQILERKFDLNLEDTKVTTTLRGFSRKKDGHIPTDSKTKIITVLLYLNEEWHHDNRSLRVLKG